MLSICFIVFFFFFQAEDGIRDVAVTGVQTCALPISCETAVMMTRSIVHYFKRVFWRGPLVRAFFKLEVEGETHCVMRISRVARFCPGRRYGLGASDHCSN